MNTAKPKRYPVDELTRLAFVYGQQDREGMAAAWPPGSPERTEAQYLARQMKAYRKKRWGRTKLEVVLDGAKPVDMSALRESAKGKQ